MRVDLFNACGRLALVALLVSLAACDAAPKTSDEDIKQVDSAQMQQMLGETSSGSLFSSKPRTTVLLDVRPAAAFAREHMPNAINIPLPEIVENDARLASAHNIILYGEGWTDFLPSAGAKKLMALRYKNVYIYRGGLELWKQEGRPVVTAPATTE